MDCSRAEWKGERQRVDGDVRSSVIKAKYMSGVDALMKGASKGGYFLLDAGPDVPFWFPRQELYSAEAIRSSMKTEGPVDRNGADHS